MRRLPPLVGCCATRWRASACRRRAAALDAITAHALAGLLSRASGLVVVADGADAATAVAPVIAAQLEIAIGVT